MILILWIFLILNFLMFLNATAAIHSIKFAKSILLDIENLHKAGIISDVQAKVYMNEMDNPLDLRALVAVKKELDEIVIKNINDTKNANR